jgi:hypothetical protein
MESVEKKIEAALKREATESMRKATEDIAEMLGLDEVRQTEPVVAELTQIEVLDEIAKAAWEISSGLDAVVDALQEGNRLYKRVHQIEE